MKNILVTGSRGFLGSTLRKALSHESDLKIMEFVRGDSEQLLTEYLKVADFVFHFAGEVRPKSTDSAFVSSNSELTEKLVNCLADAGKNTPIVYSSSVHVENPTNSYGFTKLESEKLLEEYCNIQQASIWIYRLPHIFGPGCKPNYNSVISTWIYNIIHGLEVKIYDRNIPITYCYSEDLMNVLKLHLVDESGKGCSFLQPTNVYNMTLGVVVDLLRSFKEYNTDSMPCFVSGSFEEKLYVTYQSYMSKVKDI